MKMLLHNTILLLIFIAINGFYEINSEEVALDTDSISDFELAFRYGIDLKRHTQQGCDVPKGKCTHCHKHASCSEGRCCNQTIVKTKILKRRHDQCPEKWEDTCHVLRKNPVRKMMTKKYVCVCIQYKKCCLKTDRQRRPSHRNQPQHTKHHDTMKTTTKATTATTVVETKTVKPAAQNITNHSNHGN